MAFRIGHQITCNIKKNPIFRSVSLDSSHDLKTFSQTSVDTTPNVNNACYVVNERKSHVTRARSLPLPENSSPCRWFSTRYPYDRNDNRYAEYASKSALVPASQSTSASVVHPMVVGSKSELSQLQPSNITPIVHNQINHDFLYRSRSSTSRSFKIREIRRMAQIQYERAVRAFVSPDEDDGCRYYLESAQPRSDSASEQIYSNLRKQLESNAAKAHQLQPRNIKPYGKLNTIPWIGPNVESRKQGIVAQNIRRSRYESIFEKRKRLKPPSNEVFPASSQQRDYSTVTASASCFSKFPQRRDYCTITATPTPDLEKCKEIIEEYRKLNPNCVDSSFKVAAGGKEEKQIIERTEKLISNIKKKQPSKDLLKKNSETVPSIECGKDSNLADSISDKKEVDAQNVQKILESAIKSQPKVQIPQPIKEKVILYYEEKDSHKTLCSKIIRDTDSGNSSMNTTFDEASDNVKVKTGPKLMLQSSNLNDRQYTTEELTPAANEKFVAPWLSWSDRVKQNIKNKVLIESQPTQSKSISEGPQRKDGNTSIMTNAIINNSVTKQTEVQKRQFSQSSLLSQTNKIYDSFLQEPKVFNHSEKTKLTEVGNRSKDYVGEVFPKTLNSIEKIPSLSQSSSRVFSTNSTRGVLGPEGTVMVKLRRLPKINIPEPSKDCRDSDKDECVRADDLNPIMPKKLPKLFVKTVVMSTKKKLKDAPPLIRPKSRGEPVDPPKICPKSEIECEHNLRADGVMEVSPKKLPKIVSCDYFPVEERKLVSVKLPRLKPRPVPPPLPCRNLEQETCIPTLRADHGIEPKRKKLPLLKMSDCYPKTRKSAVTDLHLKRLKKIDIPEPPRVCTDIMDECAPRADEIFGYRIKRKKLQALILGERYNNLSWKEFNEAKEKTHVRTYSTDSKCSMCCYSEKTVHPDIKEDTDTSNNWDKFNGRLFCEEGGKLKAYLLPEVIIDNSTGSELKIVKKPIGTLYRKDDHLYEELLKNGFTNIVSKSDRKFSSYRPRCNIPPEKPQYKDLRLKPPKKRSDFNKDFPSRGRFHDAVVEPCRVSCQDMDRIDNVQKYEVKPKKLPPIPKGNCDLRQKKIYKDSTKVMRRLKKRFRFKSYDCPKEECVDPCPPRADEGRVEKHKKLTPLNSISKCAEPHRQPPSNDDRKLRRLPPMPPMDREPCPPVCDCEDPDTYRSDLMTKKREVKKGLPPLIPQDCPVKPKPKMKTVRMRRLPKPPYADRIDCPPGRCEVPHLHRADLITNYQVKSKKLKALLKSNNKAFSTLPNNFLYNKNFSQFESYRSISTTFILQTTNKKCKKLEQQNKTARKCPKVNSPNAKCKAKSISCNRKQPKVAPCSKKKTPYPAFSECKEHNFPEIITECNESDKHLQPRWPILGEIKSQKPPPPYQGKIDPSKQEECIARKLNILLEGETKSCETFADPEKPRLTKEMYDEVIKNPPFEEGECAEDKKPPTPKVETKGPCPPVEKPVCPDPEIECVLPEAKPETLACGGKESTEATSPRPAKPTGATGSTGQTKSKESTGSKGKPKLVCEKKQKKKDKNKETADSEKKPEASCKKSETKIEKESTKKQKSKEKDKCEESKQKACESKKSDSPSKTRCAEGKAGKQKSCKAVGKKGSKKASGGKKPHCRNVKKCGASKTKGKSAKSGKKGKPKKCSDLLKEEDEKVKKKGKAGKGQKTKASKMADLCKQRKPCTSKKGKPSKSGEPSKKPDVYPAVLAAKCPPKKSLWQRIVDFFKARPNCPAPDQWKKDKLRKKAEQAAAAAGLELCEKKKPTAVTVTCKKTGVKESKLRKRIGKKDKKVKSTTKKTKEECAHIKPECKKSSQKKDATKLKQDCKKVKWECSTTKTGKGSSKKVKPSKSKSKSCTATKKAAEVAKPKCDEVAKAVKECKVTEVAQTKEHKTAKVVKAKECESECEKDCVQEAAADKGEEEKNKRSKTSGKCKVLPKQKFCKPRARKACKDDIVQKECATTPPPYPSFSECKKQFPKLPTTECSEQEKNIKRKTLSYDHDDSDKQVRKYSTYLVQKRFYASSSDDGKKRDPLSLFDIHEEYFKNMKNNELASKILAAIKERMKATANPDNNNIATQRYYDIFQELELLCEKELNKTISNDSAFIAKSEKTRINDVSSNANLSYSKSLAVQRNFPDVEHTMMLDAIRNFCNTVFSLPNLSTEEYEETEKLKTERLQKQLDEILDGCKTK